MMKVYAAEPTILTPYWDFAISGVSLSTDDRNTADSFELVENCDGSDILTASFVDPEFVIIEDSIYVEDAPVTFVYGFQEDAYRRTFSGFISAIDIDFPEEGMPTIVLTCFDQTHLMNREEKSRTWDNTTSAEVVKKIAAEYGFQCKVETGYTFERKDTISQSNQTDIAFIESLANGEYEPFLCKLTNGTINYIKMGLLSDPVQTLAYREWPYGIRSFSPQITKEQQKEVVNKNNVTTNTKQTDNAVVNNNSSKAETQGSAPTTSSSTPGKTWNPATQTWS